MDQPLGPRPHAERMLEKVRRKHFLAEREAAPDAFAGEPISLFNDYGGKTMPRVELYTECLGDEGIAKILFAGEDVEIINCWCTRGAICHATTDHRVDELPEATGHRAVRHRKATTEEKDGLRASTHSLILRGGTMNYFVAFAKPRPLDWVLTDPKLRRAFESSPQDMKLYLDRSNCIVELARGIPFDRSTLLEQSEDYRGLLAFIRKHAVTQAAKPSRAG